MKREFVIPPIPDRLYFKISEVSQITGVPAYVLRYWETEFEILKPPKSKANQRVYEKKHIENVFVVKKLLWHERYSIEGAKQKLIELKRKGREEVLDPSKVTEAQKMRRIKNELKDLIQFLRA